MEILLNSGLLWWITVVDIPVLSGLFWLIIRTRREGEASFRYLRETLEVRSAQLREGLSSFKLEVAKSYTAIGEMKDFEIRIISHLLRIEAKLDKTALKTAELKAESKKQ